MDFFEAQDRARRTTKWLIVIYILVTALIVTIVTLAVVAAGVYFPPILDSVWSSIFQGGPNVALNSSMYTAVPTQVFVSIASFVTLIILAGTLFKTAELMGGGGKVAAALGGTQLLAASLDSKARRLRNVVEEMAIASGVPVPDIYVLEKEGSINAFAAGFSPSDATVTVTRGAIEFLDRDELQGVIAHEFSHILNGDMRLNIRLIGLLFGTTAIHSVGLGIMIGGSMVVQGAGMGGIGVGWTADKTGALDSKILGFFVLIALGFIAFILTIGVSIVVFGAGLTLLGLLGLISARAIKSAISRQREYLADASVIQFTRQTKGIAGALRKMGGNKRRSYITAANPEIVSHMLFGKGSEKLRTHPPLTDRIKALDPSFTAGSYPDVEDLPDTSATSVQLIVESIGKPDAARVEYARNLRRSLPDNLSSAVHSVNESPLLTIALILNRDEQHLERQMHVVEQEFGTADAELVRDYYAEVSKLGSEYRLPLLEMAFPALKRREKSALIELARFTARLAKIDHAIDLYEFCFGRILRRNLLAAVNPSNTESHQFHRRLKVAQAAVYVLMMVAQKGHEDADAEQAALNAGKAVLGQLIAGAHIDLQQTITIDILDGSLNILLALHGDERRNVVLAICETAAHDGRFEVAERELIHVVCASLDCPLPPILVANS